MTCNEKLSFSSDSLKSVLDGNVKDTSFQMRRAREESGTPYLRLLADTTRRWQFPQNWIEVFDERCLAGLHFNTFDSLFIRGIDDGYWRERMEGTNGNFSIITYVDNYGYPVTFKEWYVIDDINWRPKYPEGD